MKRRHAVALLFLLVLADNAAMGHVALGPLVGVTSLGGVHWIASAWLVAMVGTIVLILRRPRWAVPLVAVLIPISTLFLSIPFIPFIMVIVPPALRVFVLLLANVAVLVASTWLLWRIDTGPVPSGLTRA